MANEKPEKYYSDSAYKNSYGLNTSSCIVGKDIFGFPSGDCSGAMRFTSIDIDRNESVGMARLVYKSVSAPGGSGRWKVKLSGIAEDNTGSFGDPFGRSKTTNYETIDSDVPNTNTVVDWQVTSIVQEIVNRSGWSRYNAMGFIFENNGSDSNVYAAASSSDSYLVYRIGSLPNFKPSPVSVSAPSIPDPMDCGLKFSAPGENVLTCSAEKLYVNTGKTQVKIEEEGVVTSSGSGVITIAHGLGGKPAVRVQFKGAGGSDNWVRLPSANYAGGVNYYLDSSNLYLYATASGQTFYYRILLDLVA